MSKVSEGGSAPQVDSKSSIKAASKELVKLKAEVKALKKELEEEREAHAKTSEELKTLQVRFSNKIGIGGTRNPNAF